MYIHVYTCICMFVRPRAATGGHGRRRAATGGDGRRRAATGGDGQKVILGKIRFRINSKLKTTSNYRRKAKTALNYRSGGSRKLYYVKSAFELIKHFKTTLNYRSKAKTTLNYTRRGTIIQSVPVAEASGDIHFRTILLWHSQGRRKGDPKHKCCGKNMGESWRAN